MKQNRLEKVLNDMKEKNIPQLIVTDPSSIFYLTGKWIHPGERMLVLYINLDGNHKLFINELFPVYEDLGVEKVWFKDTDDSVELLAKYIHKDHVIGIDKNWPSKFLLKLIQLNAAKSYVNGSDIIDKIRMKKDEEEREFMRRASKINDEAIERLINIIPEGLTEKEMGQRLLKIYEELGAEGFSFETIIAYGANAADPHHEGDNSKVKEGDCVIIDIGCKYKSYCSDMTRTVFYKNLPEKSEEIYNIVLEANKRAINTVKPGVRFCDIDKAARDYIESKGYGKYFTHRTGHSIGIDVHDLGDVSSINTDIVEPGMIFSIEPGIYLPGEVGVRIEDLVLVTEDNCEVLNSFTKDVLRIE
ncbi:M24 family metallopeptidase [Clostridium peptidivorans]|uniref:M24 family metallopeptidase n=1 Tax=Clostridium peptidivorans TaxID=100174 RepID=UPI000BE3AECD|nr:aminopeptidase P family protein [Clostridium peptidivorans]